MGYDLQFQRIHNINSLEITVKRRIALRGQVVSSDDEPLRNTSVKLDIMEGESRRRSGNSTLDDEGRFVHYLNRPGSYTVKIQYQGLSVESKPIKVEEGQQIDNLVLKLTRNSDENELQQQKRAEIVRNQQGGPSSQYESIYESYGPRCVGNKSRE